MSLKLYRVDVVIETVVLAEDPHTAAQTAEVNAYDVTHDGRVLDPVEILDVAHIPKGWEQDPPLYEGLDDVDESDLTCREIAERLQKRRTEETFAQKTEQELRQLLLFSER